MTAYTSGHFELSIDGMKTTSYLKTIDGGFMKHSLVDEAIGSAKHHIKHAAVDDVEPISFEVGMAGAAGVLKWIQESWRGDYEARNGQITHADFNLAQVFEHHFSDALITETTFPALDGASKDPAYLKVKFQPTQVITKKKSGPRLRPLGGIKQKLWLCSAFRLSIDHVKDLEYTNKLESFTIKQNVKKLHVGAFRGFEQIPTKIDFPNLTGTIALEKADGILAWYEQYISKGQNDAKAQRTGAIEFLSPDRKKTLLRIKLGGVGVLDARLLQSTANSDQIKRVKFELYVSDMELELPGAFGLES